VLYNFFLLLSPFGSADDDAHNSPSFLYSPPLLFFFPRWWMDGWVDRFHHQGATPEQSTEASAHIFTIILDISLFLVYEKEPVVVCLLFVSSFCRLSLSTKKFFFLVGRRLLFLLHYRDTRTARPSMYRKLGIYIFCFVLFIYLSEWTSSSFLTAAGIADFFGTSWRDPKRKQKKFKNKKKGPAGGKRKSRKRPDVLLLLTLFVFLIFIISIEEHRYLQETLSNPFDYHDAIYSNSKFCARSFKKKFTEC
jgi:hypothetical protein